MDQATDLYILAHSEMFCGLASDQLDRVRSACVRKRLAKGETLFHQDEPASALYVVVAGRLMLSQTTSTGQQVIIRFLGKGETVGSDAILGERGYSNCACAVEDTVLMSWAQGRFRQLMEKHTRIALNAVSVIQARYEELETRLRELATETVERRIAYTLLRLARQAGRRTAAGIEIGFPLSRQNIAEMAGTTLHTVSRTISAWESEGVIDSGRRRVVVRNPYQLNLIAGDKPPERTRRLS